ncbi:hypothetical protein [Streptomyces sp. NPDC087294]|uniref:hypothetical protein n=1 Tax=Streptomyces sp. NPDC087294 TaxID=3365777 RepID=UPI00382EAAB1
MDIDLSDDNYIVFAEKPPQVVPGFARYERAATQGAAPFTYATSDPKVADVDDSGTVYLRGNGECTIKAVDSDGTAAEYTLTVRGISTVHLLSSSADWQGMEAMCSAALVRPVTLAEMKRLWTLYFPSSGPVADYMELLNYPVWTADLIGADTAWAYDLNGSSVNDNASGNDKDTFFQVLGIAKA